MMAQTDTKGWIDGSLFNANRAKFTYDQLAPYAGQHVAWSADGTRIVAHNVEVAELFREIDESDLANEDVVFSYIPALDAPETLL